MEFTNKRTDFQEEDIYDNSNINIKDVIDNYLSYWKWFILSVIISLAVTFYILNFIRPQYKASATIKIKDDQGGDNSTLSVFEDLGVMGGSNAKIEDEIEILKSTTLISEVIKSLKLNVQLYTNKNRISEFLDDNLGLETEFYENEKYRNIPIKINFFIADTTLFNTVASFIIHVNSVENFTCIDLDTKNEKKYSFGETVSLGFGEFIIIPNTDLVGNNFIGTNILVSINSIYNLASSYANRIEIEPKSEHSSILSMTLKDAVKERAEDFLNELVDKYNERAIYLKEQLSKNTSSFVTKRLEIISNELSTVDLTAETLKTRYGLSDVASETGLNMQSGQEIEQQIVQANTQLQQIEYIKEYVSAKDDTELIPADVGVADNNVTTSMQQYNELMLEKKRLLEYSTEKNPIVVNISEQLKNLKNNINQGLNNLESSQKISIDALNKQDARINSRLYSAPKQERQYRDVQRQQQIKEALYLYLLQKREETAITLGVVDPNAKIIDSARSTPWPISPKKNIFYLAAVFLGLLIPLIIIYLIDFLNTKVKSREDIEKLLNIPILGDIPKLESKKSYLINKDDHSSVAEAFRILRTNLSFLLTQTGEKGKTVFITSTIAHEGKSFVSSNLAASLAHTGKKTLLIGMDVRAPKIKSYLGIKGDIGVTNYIIDTDITINGITIKVPTVENLELISSGNIPPNPSELLMNSRVKELFDEVKQHYEYIIVDTAASSIITDTMILRDYADAFVYVIRADYLDKRHLGYVKSLHKDKRFRNMALLINGVDHKKAGYGYGYGYGAKFEKSDSKRWWKLNT